MEQKEVPVTAPPYVKLDVKLNILPTERIEPIPNRHNIYYYDYTKTLMDLAYSFLSEYGYKVTEINEDNYEKNCLVEDHVYISTTDRGVKSQFNQHCDDEGGTSFPVHTCIFYLENTFESGGDLNILHDGKYDSEVIETIDTRKLTVLLLHGQTYHEITPMVGKGRRRCIVVQLRSGKGKYEE